MSRIWCSSSEIAVRRYHVRDGPLIRMLVIRIGSRENSDRVFAFAYALQHYSR